MRLFSSVRVRLLLLVALAVLPALAVFVVSSLEQRSYAKEKASEDARRITDVFAYNHEQAEAETRSLLTTLTQLSEVAAAGPALCSNFLQRLAPQYPQYTGIFIAEADGTVTCTSTPSGGQTYIGDRDYFRQALAADSFASSGLPHRTDHRQGHPRVCSALLQRPGRA